MQREIKFRAWLPSMKKMTYTHTLDELMNWNTKPEDNGTAVWLQYTGIHDKNGKEIYEGDECEVYRTCVFARGFIKFHQGCFIFREYKTGNILRLSDLELNGYTIKVTGLAIENPELVEVSE